MFNLNINNFRGFTNQSFEFNKINILIGENNGGKSSLLKFFLLLRQTIDYPRTNLKIHGNWVDLANYKTMIQSNDVNKNFEFTFAFPQEDCSKLFNQFFSSGILNVITKSSKLKLPRGKTLFDRFIKTNKQNVVKFKITKNLDKLHDIGIKISNEDFGSIDITHSKDIMEYNCKIKIQDKKNNKQILLKNLTCDISSFFRLVDAGTLYRSCKVVDKSMTLFFKITYMLLTQNLVESLLRNINYVNPIDSIPQRAYLVKDLTNDFFHNTIDNFITYMENRPAEFKKKFVSILNDMLKDYGIVTGVRFQTNTNISNTEVRARINSKWYNIKDMGYGLTPSLAIIMSLILRSKKILLIEQPELHIHPQLVAKLMEVLVKYNDKGTYFIETHSEHMIRKLQVLIKHKKYNLLPSSVSIYYFKRGKTTFEITKHNINEEGELNPAFPKGFFDTSYNLVKALYL